MSPMLILPSENKLLKISSFLDFCIYVGDTTLLESHMITTAGCLAKGFSELKPNIQLVIGGGEGG